MRALSGTRIFLSFVIAAFLLVVNPIVAEEIESTFDATCGSVDLTVTGDLDFVGVIVTLDGDEILAGSSVMVEASTMLELDIRATEPAVFNKFYVQLSNPNGDVAAEELVPKDLNVSQNLAACAGRAPPSVGLTHIDETEKTLASATINAAAGNRTLDITIVVSVDNETDVSFLSSYNLIADGAEEMTETNTTNSSSMCGICSEPYSLNPNKVTKDFLRSDNLFKNRGDRTTCGSIANRLDQDPELCNEFRQRVEGRCCWVPCPVCTNGTKLMKQRMIKNFLRSRKGYKADCATMERLLAYDIDDCSMYKEKVAKRCCA